MIILPRVKVEVVLNDDQGNVAIKAIGSIAGNGKIDDGRIFVSPVEKAIHIRIGETGSESL